MLYDDSKTYNKLLHLINATVSHEMRNPLNSVISQSIVNDSINKQLLILVSNLKIDKKVKEVILEKIKKLMYSNKV